jgi:hypothetical protein
LYPPTSIANVFGNWVHGIDNKFRILLRVGAIALIRSLWLYRNDKVFYNKNYTPLQVIYRCTGTLRLWSQLHRMEDHDLFSEVCTRLEDTGDTCFRTMDGSIIFRLVLHHLRRLTISHSDMQFAYFLYCYLDS